MRGGRCNGNSERREEGEKVAREKESIISQQHRAKREEKLECWP